MTSPLTWRPGIKAVLSAEAQKSILPKTAAVGPQGRQQKCSLPALRRPARLVAERSTRALPSIQFVDRALDQGRVVQF